jgi:DNA-binding CsgD family transcriptional regulator
MESPCGGGPPGADSFGSEEPTHTRLVPAAGTGQSEFALILRARLDELASVSRLTPRERQVLDLLVLGRTSAEIGTALSITARTAKFHQANVLRKIGADSRLDIVRLLL